MRPGIFIAVAILLAPLLAPGAAAARHAGIQPLDRLLPQIRRAYPGEFYDADGPTPGPGGSQHYHLKWMTPDGRIVWLDTDARTGRVLGESPGRDTFDGPRVYGPPGGYEPRGYYSGPEDFYSGGGRGYDGPRGGRGHYGGRGFGGRGFGGRGGRGHHGRH